MKRLFWLLLLMRLADAAVGPQSFTIMAGRYTAGKFQSVVAPRDPGYRLGNTNSDHGQTHPGNVSADKHQHADDLSSARHNRILYGRNLLFRNARYGGQSSELRYL
jgi:hypothetical protein